MTDARELDLLTLTARRAGELLRAGEVSPAELADAYLDRISSDPDETNAFVHVDRAATHASVAHAETLASGGDLPLRGVPIALKDLLSTKDMPTTCASRILEGFHPVYDATSVERVRAAGLVNLGKANMDEFAMGSSNETSAYGPVRNPWNPGTVPGGSSGGSAAAVAGGFAPWALGSDTGGSIRQPASLCGIVGMKPTYGVVSRYGLIAFASSLDQIGPMTKDVEDCAALLEIIAAKDPRDTTSVGPREPIALERRDRLDGVRLGLPKQFMAEGIDPDVKAVIEENLRQGRGERQGFSYSRVSNPTLSQLEQTLATAKPDDRFQFERHGYFVADRVDSADGRPVFNRAVSLKDSWGAGKGR